MIKVDKGVVESKFFCESEIKADAVTVLMVIHDELVRMKGSEGARQYIRDIFREYDRLSKLSDEEAKREHNKIVMDLALKLIKSIVEDK